MALFNDRLHGAANANAVTTHDHMAGLFLIIRVNRVEFLGILGAEDKDVADFNTTSTLQRLARQWAGFTRAHAPEITKLRYRQIARHIDISHVKSVLVRPGRTVANQADRFVSKYSCECLGLAQGAFDRTQATGLRSHEWSNLVRRRRPDDIKSQAAKLGFLQIIVTA